jgi:hypothetical protein
MKMKELINVYTPDYQRLIPIPEYSPVMVLLGPRERDSLEKDKEVLPINR